MEHEIDSFAISRVFFYSLLSGLIYHERTCPNEIAKIVTYLKKTAPDRCGLVHWSHFDLIL